MDDGAHRDDEFELDLDERACPTCHRALRPWEEDCPDCRAPAVLRMSLPGALPAVPAHLRVEHDDDPAASDASEPSHHPSVAWHALSTETEQREEQRGDDDPPEPPPVGGPVLGGGGPS